MTTGAMPPCASSLRPWPSRCWKRLERLAVLADVDAAVGEHAVDVEDRSAMPSTALRARAAARARKRARVAAAASHQMTFARIRSLLLSAPTSAPSRVDHQHAGDAVLLHQLGRLDRQRVVAHQLRGRACITSRGRAARAGRTPLLDQAAQVAVGEDAQHAAARHRRRRWRPGPWRVISRIISLKQRVGADARHGVAACASRRARASAACGRARRRDASARSPRSRKPRASSSATASASPSAICAVVLAVGARFSGQASLSTRAVEHDVGMARRASSRRGRSSRPACTPRRLSAGRMAVDLVALAASWRSPARRRRP